MTVLHYCTVCSRYAVYISCVFQKDLSKQLMECEQQVKVCVLTYFLTCIVLLLTHEQNTLTLTPSMIN